MRSHGHLLTPLNTYASPSSSSGGTTSLLATHAPHHPAVADQQTLASAIRRSSAANAFGFGAGGSGSGGAGSGSGAGAGAASPRSSASMMNRGAGSGTSTLSSERRGSLRNMMSISQGATGRAPDRPRPNNNNDEEEESGRSPSRPVSPGTVLDDSWSGSAKGNTSNSNGVAPSAGPSWLGHSSNHHLAAKPRDRFPSISLGFGFADDSMNAANLDSLPGGAGSRKQSMTVGDAFSLAGFGLNKNNNALSSSSDSWAPDTSAGSDLLSLNSYRRKSSIIAPRFTPAPSTSATTARAFPAGVNHVPDARNSTSVSPEVYEPPKTGAGGSFLPAARRSSNIGLLLNPVSDGDVSGSKMDEQSLMQQQQQQQQQRHPNESPSNSSTAPVARRGAISAAPEWRGPQTNDPIRPTNVPETHLDMNNNYPGPSYSNLYSSSGSSALPGSRPYGQLADANRQGLYGGTMDSAGRTWQESNSQGVEHDRHYFNGMDMSTGRRQTVGANMPRQFKCAHCPASFVRNHDLRRHARIHLAVKPFACNDCGKPFSRKDALKRHILVKGCGGRRKRKNGKNAGTAAEKEKTEPKEADVQQDSAAEEEEEDEQPMAARYAASDSQPQAQQQQQHQHQLHQQQTAQGYYQESMPSYNSMNVNYANSARALPLHSSIEQQGNDFRSSTGPVYGNHNYGSSQATMSPAMSTSNMSMMSDATRGRAATLDSYPRPSYGVPAYMMWGAYNGSTASHSPALSSQSSLPFSNAGTHHDGNTATLLSPAFARADLHANPDQHVHYSPLVSTSGLLTREERRASLTRANSELPTFPTNGGSINSVPGQGYHNQPYSYMTRYGQ